MITSRVFFINYPHQIFITCCHYTEPRCRCVKSARNDHRSTLLIFIKVSIQYIILLIVFTLCGFVACKLN
ncbi:hypothetical protein BC355_08700 [Vibrio cholerae]|uniref:Uncharacterized protein n=1 Tax=Vibrio cholerae TaxID=666 RepID=A0A395U197_VIBCL|nr:hypothetical protein BC354_07070 [Vibrio cholerae]RGP90319.1 hypothetical protein BC353_09165 [Vibrio cholerae]RGP90389.1 hypothetical protein BC355_08700 [Vibrio cholerae]RGP92856.1 hypothetical protein BC352_07060 [Vibrio cholerae]